MRRKRNIPLLSILIFNIQCSSATGKLAVPQEPSTSIGWMRITSSVGIVGPGKTHQVMAVAFVKEDTEHLWCPEEEWDWGDGSRSGQQPDCPPFDQTEAGKPRKYQRSHQYRSAGDMNFAFTLRKNDRVIFRYSQTIVISDGR